MRKFVNLIVSLIILVLFGAGFRELMMFQKAETEITELQNAVVRELRKENGENSGSSDKNGGSTDPLHRKIDFELLSGINPDIVAWVYVPGTRIDYPVLMGKNDTKYLYRNYKNQYSSIGSIFTYAGTDFSEDHNIFLFGHNMISGQMFSGLKKYKSADYGHKTMYIYTPERTRECTAISAFRCHRADKVFGTDTDVASLNARSSVGYEPQEEGQVFSLCTCDGYEGTPYRFTVHFTVTKEKFVLD